MGKKSHIHIGRPNIVKMAILPDLIHRFSTIPVIIPVDFFMKMDKLTLKLILKGTQNSQNNPEKEELSSRTYTSQF